MSVRLIRKRIEQRHVQLSPHKTLWMTSNEQRYLLLHSNKRRRILRRDWRHLRLTWTFRGIIPLRFISSALFARSFINSRKIQYWSTTSFLSIYLKYTRYSILFFVIQQCLKVLINSRLNQVRNDSDRSILDKYNFFLIFIVSKLSCTKYFIKQDIRSLVSKNLKSEFL